MKRQSTTPACIEKLTGCVTYWSSRKNASFEPSEVSVIRGNTYQQGIRLWHNTECTPVRSLLFYLRFFHSPSSPSSPPTVGRFFFCSVEFPKLFQLFHRRLGITRENNASSCFGWWCWLHVLCAVIQPSFIQEKSSPEADWIASTI